MAAVTARVAGPKGTVNLARFDNSWFDPGRGFVVRALWHLTSAVLFQNPLNPSSALKAWLLRLFGARVGKQVIIKPSVNIKYPWNLSIGDYSWIGEHAWLDSLAEIRIGSSACISQGAYLCTGNHDWSDPAFGLIVKPIVIQEGAWVGARAIVLPGVTVKTHSVVTSGSVVSSDTEAYQVHAGNPAVPVKDRRVRDESPRR